LLSHTCEKLGASQAPAWERCTQPWSSRASFIFALFGRQARNQLKYRVGILDISVTYIGHSQRNMAYDLSELWNWKSTRKWVSVVPISCRMIKKFLESNLYKILRDNFFYLWKLNLYTDGKRYLPTSKKPDALMRCLTCTSCPVNKEI
jgi:hypothetical protein